MRATKSRYPIPGRRMDLSRDRPGRDLSGESEFGVLCPVRVRALEHIHVRQMHPLRQPRLSPRLTGVPVVTNRGGGGRRSPYTRRGLAPSWARDSGTGNRMIGASPGISAKRLPFTRSLIQPVLLIRALTRASSSTEEKGLVM